MFDVFTSKEIEHIKICLEKQNNAFFIAYLALLLHEQDMECTSLDATCSLISDEKIRHFVKSKLSENKDVEKFINLVVQFEKSALVGFMMTQRTETDFKLPQSLAILAGKCAEIKSDDLLIDVFPRDGEFLIVNYSRYRMREAIGYQLSEELFYINKIKALIMDQPLSFVNKSFLEADIPTADRFFVVPPFGIKTTEKDKALLHEVCKKYPELENTRTQEILYIVKAVENLKENGKVVCCLPSGFLSNTGRSETAFRKWLFDNHLIESSILFSPKINYQTTAIQLAFIVLSKNEKKHFTVVDATEFCHKSVKGSTIELDNVDSILEAIKEEGKYSKVISIENVSDTYNLNPAYFLAHTEVVETYGYESAEISSIAEIIRGCNSIQKELDNRLTDDNTSIKYLSASWEDPNKIPNDLPALSSLKDNEYRYCAKEGDFILSKMGNPKFDVIKKRNDEEILVSGNLYIVRFDQSKVLPMYAKAFFEGSGNILLEDALTGSVTPTLSVDMLKKIKIPLIPMEKQKEIANNLHAFELMQDEFNEKIKKIGWRIESLFDDVMNNKTNYYTEDGDLLL